MTINTHSSDPEKTPTGDQFISKGIDDSDCAGSSIPEDLTPAQLLHWRDRLIDIRDRISLARLNYVMPQMGCGSPGDDLLIEAQEGLLPTIRSLGIIARKIGLPEPKEQSEPESYSLSDWNALDTPNARALLEALERAQELAELVDAERGHSLPEHIPLQPGESRGCDIAEELSYINLRLRSEIHPRRGRD